MVRYFKRVAIGYHLLGKVAASQHNYSSAYEYKVLERQYMDSLIVEQDSIRNKEFDARFEAGAHEAGPETWVGRLFEKHNIMGSSHDEPVANHGDSKPVMNKP